MTDKRKERERILMALRSYVNLGLPIIPLCPYDHNGMSDRHEATCKQAGKIPLLKGWREHETTTMEQVTSWIREFRNLNIGLPLGKSSGYIGIDVDGLLGEDMLDEMSGGDLPETWEYSTGAGRRLLYTLPPGMQTKKYVNPHEEGGHNECSILCDGQQTVMPPSIHHTGRVYEWVTGSSPDDIDCAEAPGWLLDLVRAEETATGVGHRRSSGTIDLDDPTATYQRPDKPANSVVVKPIVVSETTLPAEFSNFNELELDTRPPDGDYTGKAAKEQKQEDPNKVSNAELTQRISSGGRDNQMTRIIGSFCAQFRALGKDYIMHMAKSHNLTYCDPPLDELAIEAKVTHFWEMEQMKSSQFRNGKAESDKAEKFAPGRVAQVVINQMEEQGYCLKVDPEQPVVWVTKKSEGPWRPVDTRTGTFQVHLKEPLGNPELGGDPSWTTIRHYKDAANALVVELRSQNRLWSTSSKNLDTQTISAFPHIPLMGGKLLNWRSGELLPWDPESNLTYVLPIQYDPQAKCPNWLARLEEWLPDEGSRLIMQEFIGYSFIPYMGFEKALVIQGEGANGKSLFLETIQGLLGYEVVDSINMRNLFSRFGQADLVGKILNIVNEAGSEYLRGGAADDFKNLVSGGRIKADVKNLAPLTFNNTAKFIFASNHDVKTGDKSEGWLRRMLIIPFDQNFRDSKTPKFEIMEALRAEYSGIFNWAVEGLRRLMQNQEFSDSETARKKKASYVQENDVAADFFMNCLQTFDLSAASGDGKIIRSGTPSALVNIMFGDWIEYRESSIQKKVDHITKYLEKKHSLSKARTTHTLLVKKTMTECWIGLKVVINDTGFLEAIINNPYHKFPELKEYAITRLKEIDEADGYNGPGPSSPNNITHLPASQAQ